MLVLLFWKLYLQLFNIILYLSIISYTGTTRHLNTKYKNWMRMILES